MTIGRRLLFSLVTLVLVFGVVEAVCWAAWLALEARAMQVRTEKATENLKANAINFLVQTDPLLGFVLKPNNAASGTNSAGFVQFDEVPIARTAGRQRIATFGESTTQGHGPGRANYPHHLKHLLEDPVVGGGPVDVINAGVAGWNSDQVALWAQHKVARYQPDVAVFYTGWNDFQSYDPFGPPPVQSYFEMAYGNPFRIQSDFPIKTVVFAVAAYEATLRSAPKVGLTGSREDAGKYG
ncbi:MAG TPA: SGNH/GDSL hydrolase family protein, partial [Reyranellaceae bacterium]|nr:SGNH/GDSL hydrolase family protein [Reyranellaceae bacterium]